MFNGEKYLTRGVDDTIPLEIQMFIWDAISKMPTPKDYLQVFDCKVANGIQSIHHYTEQPKFDMTYVLPTVREPVTAKIYVIDDYYSDEDKHIATMLLAEEY